MADSTVAVLLPVYAGDGHAVFSKAIWSVLKQSRQPDQIVVVFDGPICTGISSLVDELLSRFPFISVVNLEKNFGLPVALNKGLELVTCDWVARFDADDIMAPHRLEQQMRFVKKSNVDILGGQILEFSESGQKLERRVPLEQEKIKSMLIWRNPLNHVTVLIRADLLRAYGYRDVPGYEDYDLWFRLLADSDVSVSNLDSILVFVRAGSEMYGRRVGLQYALNELKFRFLTTAFTRNKLLHWFAGFLRASSSVLPMNVKSRIYRLFLRSGPKL